MNVIAKCGLSYSKYVYIHNSVTNKMHTTSFWYIAKCGDLIFEDNCTLM